MLVQTSHQLRYPRSAIICRRWSAIPARAYKLIHFPLSSPQILFVRVQILTIGTPVADLMVSTKNHVAFARLTKRVRVNFPQALDNAWVGITLPP